MGFATPWPTVRPDKTHFVGELEAARIDVVALGGGRLPWPGELARLLRRARPDLVHSHSPLPAAVARCLLGAGVGGRRPHVYTEHNRWQSYRLPTRAVNALTMPIDRRVWAVSEEARRSVRPPRLRDRVVVLHHGIDVAATRRRAEDQRAALPPDGLEDEGATVLVHIANRRPAKAHDHLLDAFALAARDRDDLVLWLVGQGLDDPAFARQVATHPRADRIRVLGYRSDALGLLAAGDVLVLSSDHEGLPVAIMEATALGRPVVSTEVGGIPEAVRDGVEALLVPRRDAAALADAWCRLADDPALAARLGEAARQRSTSFDASRSVGEQLRTYRTLTDG